jgi:hypothetical protein
MPVTIHARSISSLLHEYVNVHNSAVMIMMMILEPRASPVVTNQNYPRWPAGALSGGGLGLGSSHSPDRLESGGVSVWSDGNLC